MKASNDALSEIIGYTFVFTIEPGANNEVTRSGYAMEYDRYFHLVRKEKLY
jgi:hypothetical protein